MFGKNSGETKRLKSNVTIASNFKTLQRIVNNRTARANITQPVDAVFKLSQRETLNLEIEVPETVVFSSAMYETLVILTQFSSEIRGIKLK